MVVRTVQDNVFNSEAKHIAFAVNAEGFNDSGFAGQVSSEYWNELANCGEYELGTVLSKTVGDKTFHLSGSAVERSPAKGSISTGVS